MYFFIQILQRQILKRLWLMVKELLDGGSPGLLVMGRDWRLIGCKFEYRPLLIDGSFLHLFVLAKNILVKMSKIIEKCPIFVKKISKVEVVTWFCVFAFYFNDQSSNPDEFYNSYLLCKECLKRVEMNKKRPRIALFK